MVSPDRLKQVPAFRVLSKSDELWLRKKQMKFAPRTEVIYENRVSFVCAVSVCVSVCLCVPCLYVSVCVCVCVCVCAVSVYGCPYVSTCACVSVCVCLSRLTLACLVLFQEPWISLVSPNEHLLQSPVSAPFVCPPCCCAFCFALHALQQAMACVLCVQLCTHASTHARRPTDTHRRTNSLSLALFFLLRTYACNHS